MKLFSSPPTTWAIIQRTPYMGQLHKQPCNKRILGGARVSGIYGHTLCYFVGIYLHNNQIERIKIAQVHDAGGN